MRFLDVRFATALILAFLAALPRVEAADDTQTAEAKASAKKLIEEGNRRLEDGKFDEALAQYEQAFLVFPSPKIYFNLAEAHRELGHRAIAADNYERFLAEGAPKKGSPTYREAKRHLDQLDKKMGRLVLTSAVAGAEVVIDGVRVGALPLPTIRVEAGPREILATHPGYEPFKATITPKIGEVVTLEVKLDLIPPRVVKRPDPPKLAAPPPPPPEEPGLLSRWWFWTAVGVATAATVGAVVALQPPSDRFVPGGELGVSSTAEWEPIR